ncbi:putative peptidase E related protein [Mycoplasma sp. CAG:776]|nr:putative peptidase E related protein [Mycoplasma sp. CAG:776]
MISVLLSKIEQGMKLVTPDLKKYLNEHSHVLILPWAFPIELTKESFQNDYFKEGTKKYNKYIEPLLNLGIQKENIIISNPYQDTKEKLKNKLTEVDCLVLPGGNPEMLFNKIVHKFDLLYDIKYFKGVIIGESAGAVLQFERYFITAKNNYYKYFAFYDGFGLLKDPFYLDVHSTNQPNYLRKLEKIATEHHKNIYAIFDDGALIINREDLQTKTIGNVKKILGGKEK